MPNKEVSVLIRARDATAAGIASARRGIGGFVTGVKDLLAGFGGFLGGVALGSFFHGAVEESTGAARAISQLENTLGNFGVSLRTVRPEIDEAVAAVQRLSGRDDDEIVDGLDRLVSKTGDYRASLANLTLVADVAAKKQISYGEAADIVGKIMSGQTRAAKEFGITTTDAGVALEQLRARVAGAAATEFNTFAGVQRRIVVGWGDFQQAVGDVITGNRTLNHELGTLAGSLGNLGKWIKDNERDVGRYATNTIANGKAIGVSLVYSFRIVGDAIGVVLGMVGHAAASLGRAVVHSLNNIPRAINRMIEDANKLPGIRIDFRVPLLDEDRWDAARDRMTLFTAGAARDFNDSLESIDRAWKDAAETTAAAEFNALGVHERAANAARTRAAATRDTAAAAHEAAKAFEQEVTTMTQAANLHLLRGQDLARLIDMERQLIRELRGGNLALADRVKKTEQLRALEAAARSAGIDALPSVPVVDGTTAQDVTTVIRGGRGPAPILPGAVKSGRDEALGQTISHARKEAEEFAVTMDDVVGASINGFTDATTRAFGAFGQGWKAAGNEFKKGMGGALADLAGKKGRFYAAEAAADLALVFTGHAGAAGAFAQHTLAAGAMFAIAGAGSRLGAGASGGGGGSGSRSLGGRDTARDSEQLAGAARGTTTVEFPPGGVANFYDPAVRRWFEQLVKDAGAVGAVRFVGS